MSSATLIQQVQTDALTQNSLNAIRVTAEHAHESGSRDQQEFADHRASATAQRHQRNIADNSQQVRQLHSLQSAMQSKSQPTQLMSDIRTPIQRKAVPYSASSSAVVQRLTRPAPVVGTATSYHVTAADLGTGTGTTAPVRVWTQGNAPGPNPINFRYATSNMAGTAVGAWNGPYVAPNPAPLGGANWHAGHILARQNGGAGHLPSANWIMPQNPQVNMGHAGTYGAWRAHEAAFNTLVNMTGAGVWEVY